MIVFKKKILYIAAAAMVVLFSFIAAYSIASATGLESPLFPITVVIDAGHGGKDRGASGVSGKVYESDLNLEIALRLRKYFINSDIGVILTRQDKNGLYGSPAEGFKMRDMEKRKEIINGSGAVMVLSIHLNTYPSASRKGAQAFYKASDPSGLALAKSIQKQFNEHINAEKGYPALKGDYYILNCSDIPSVILECGFLSNPDDELNLSKAAYQERIAYSIFAGAIFYLNSV